MNSVFCPPPVLCLVQVEFEKKGEWGGGGGGGELCVVLAWGAGYASEFWFFSLYLKLPSIHWVVIVHLSTR